MAARIPVIRIPTLQGLIEVEADADPAAVMRMVQMLNRAPEKEKGDDALGAKWTAFAESLTDGGRSFLEHVRANPGVTLEELTSTIADGNVNAVSGFMRGVYKHAKRLGIKMSLIYRREEEGTSRDHTLRYFPGKLLAEKGVDIGAIKEAIKTKG